VLAAEEGRVEGQVRGLGPRPGVVEGRWLSMTEAVNFAGDAGEYFESGAGFAFEDARVQRLRYHLLRLTIVGLRREDVGPLCELARLAFEDADVTDQVTAIKERPDASALASTIAAIVERAGPGDGGPAGRADVMVGAVVGAYAGLRDTGSRNQAHTAIVGAIGGGIAASVGRFIRTQIAEIGAAEYVRMDESS
jgi:hypothetical protein